MKLNNIMKYVIVGSALIIIAIAVYYYQNSAEDCKIYTKLDVSNIFPP